MRMQANLCRTSPMIFSGVPYEGLDQGGAGSMIRPLANVVAAALLAAATNSAAALPPKYLAVQDFKACLSTQQISTYRAWCMPAKKPENCPAASWAQLKALRGTDQVPACPKPKSQSQSPTPEEKKPDA